MLHLRDAHGIATGELLEVPEPGDPAVLVLINRLAIGAIQISVFNFAEREARPRIVSALLRAGDTVVDLGTSQEVARVESPGRHSSAADGAFELSLAPFGFQALIIKG